MPYISNTDEDKSQMLADLGLESVEKLFSDIPDDLRPKSFDLPAGKSELEIRQYLQKLAHKNATGLICFLGGGFYDHFIPSAVLNSSMATRQNTLKVQLILRRLRSRILCRLTT